jgi:hypothetical protein
MSGRIGPIVAYFRLLIVAWHQCNDPAKKHVVARSPAHGYNRVYVRPTNLHRLVGELMTARWSLWPILELCGDIEDARERPDVALRWRAAGGLGWLSG